MSTRIGWIAAAWMVACTPDDGVSTPFTPRPEDNLGTRFERLAQVADPGDGVVPLDMGPGAWVAREGAIEEVGADGVSGTHVDVSAVGSAPVLLDRSGERFLLAAHDALDAVGPAGQPMASWSVEGEVLAARLTDTGVAAVVREGEVCSLVTAGSDGDPVGTDAPCDLGGDVDAWPGEGVRVAADGGRTFALDGDTAEVMVYEGGALATSFGLDRVVVDVAARAGQLLVLSDDQVMIQLDPETGRALAEWKVFRPQGLDTLQLAADGLGVVLSGGGSVVFFRFDPSATGYLLPDNPNYGSPPNQPGPGGLSGGGAPPSGPYG